MMRITRKVTILSTTLALAGAGTFSAGLAETIPPTTPALEKPLTVEITDSAALQKHATMLRDERQLLERQADRHISSMERLYDRGITVFVGLVGFAFGLFFWQFDKTKKGLREETKDMMKGYVRESVDEEAEELRKRLRSLKDQVDDINSYKSRKLVWIIDQEDSRIEPILGAFRAFDITNVQIIEGRKPDDITLDNPDLVILSFDGTDHARSLLRKVVEWMRSSNLMIPLLVFTYNYGGSEIRLSQEDFKILKDFYWCYPANFPATLIAHTTSLLRRGRKTVQ